MSFRVTSFQVGKLKFSTCLPATVVISCANSGNSGRGCIPKQLRPSTHSVSADWFATMQGVPDANDSRTTMPEASYFERRQNTPASRYFSKSSDRSKHNENATRS